MFFICYLLLNAYSNIYDEQGCRILAMKQYNWQAQKSKMTRFTVFCRHILRNDAIHGVLQAYFEFLQALFKEMTRFTLFCRHILGFCRHFFAAIHGVSQAHFWWLKKLTGTFYFSAHSCYKSKVFFISLIKAKVLWCNVLYKRPAAGVASQC